MYNSYMVVIIMREMLSEIECGHHYFRGSLFSHWSEHSLPPLLLQPVEHFSSVVLHLLVVGPSLHGHRTHCMYRLAPSMSGGHRTHCMYRLAPSMSGGHRTHCMYRLAPSMSGGHRTHCMYRLAPSMSGGHRTHCMYRLAPSHEWEFKTSKIMHACIYLHEKYVYSILARE